MPLLGQTWREALIYSSIVQMVRAGRPTRVPWRERQLREVRHILGVVAARQHLAVGRSVERMARAGAPL